MPPQYKAPRGTADILPVDRPYWSHITGTAERLCEMFGYARVDTPIFEEASVFHPRRR